MRLPYRVIHVLCLLIVLNGCVAWHTPEMAPGAVLEKHQPSVVRVTRQDQSRFFLYKPVMDGDSLRGRVRKGEAVIPLSDVQSLAVTQTQAAATVFGIVVVAGLVGVLIMLSTVQIGF